MHVMNVSLRFGPLQPTTSGLGEGLLATGVNHYDED